jgi:hypothetical protein
MPRARIAEPLSAERVTAHTLPPSAIHRQATRIPKYPQPMIKRRMGYPISVKMTTPKKGDCDPARGAKMSKTVYKSHSIVYPFGYSAHFSQVLYVSPNPDRLTALPRGGA